MSIIRVWPSRVALLLILGLPVRADAQGTVVVRPALARVSIPIGKGPTEHWRWHNDSTPVNRLEYTWSASIEGDTTYSFGFQLFKSPDAVPKLGTFAELLRAGQSSLWIAVGSRARTVRDVRPNLRVEGSSLVIELRDSSLIAMLFARGPAQLVLQIQTLEQPRTREKVVVQYEGFQPTVFAPAYAPSPPKTKRPCHPEVVDTQQYGASVNRDCDTDRPAILTHEEQPPYRFPRNVSCGIVELSFIVDSSGIIMPSTAALISTNAPEYAMLVVASLSKWRYEPAMLNGKPVAQLVMVRHARPDDRVPSSVDRAPARIPPIPPCQ